jgi:hypothetical protein
MENERNDRKDQKDVYQGTRYVKHREPADPCQQEQEKQDHVDTHAFPPFGTTTMVASKRKNPHKAITVFLQRDNCS